MSATGEGAEQTFFRRSAWTTSEREVLGSRTLNLLPWSLAVTRKGPINYGASLQDRSGEHFMTESPTSRDIGVECEFCLWVISSLEAFSFSRTEARIVWKLIELQFRIILSVTQGGGRFKKHIIRQSFVIPQNNIVR